MNCPICGSELKEGANFCGFCGGKVEAPSTASTASAAPSATQPAQAQSYNVQPQSSPQTQSSPTYSAQPQSTNASSSAGNSGSPYNVPSNPYGASQQSYQQEGCLGAAWRDITSSAGWIKRLLFLAIMNCVPVLNFYVSGYSVKWGADVASGKREPLPRGNFTKHTFVVGLFAWILSVLMTVANIWFYAIDLIPIIGVLVTFVLSLFASAFLALATMRMALRRKFGAAFDLSEIIIRYKKRVGSLLASAVVPGIIMGAIFVVIAIILVMIFGGIAMAGLSSSSYVYSSLYYSMSSLSYNPVGAILGIVSALGAVIVFLVMLALFLAAFANVWSMRAVGHWVAQNAPEWVDEAAEQKIEEL